ncbi:MAG: ribonuclease HII [Hydrogenophilales bacterium 28-61-23]|nr:MAG: ribonuclease HII [Hydrogenophilales bacterium 28-61-23]
MSEPVLICGVDEAGRGPLAGSVYAAAVILDPAHPIAGLKDSKVLSEKKRRALAEEIKAHALSWSIAFATVEEIERLNILHASMLAMQRAVSWLSPAAEFALIDGNRCPQLLIPARAIVKGDASEACISAASILAKTERDQEMRRLADTYPMYGFERHAGYPTAAHLAALEAHGASPIHRKSFGPVKRILNKTDADRRT